MPISLSVGCPFDCEGLVNIDEDSGLGKCVVCNAYVYSTTSEKRLKIIDGLFATGVRSVEISQVVDYSARKKTPKSFSGTVVFAVRSQKR